MRKLLTTAVAGAMLMAVPACSTISPAPLEQTTADEKALIVALDTFDTLLASVDIMIDAGLIEPGSERAIALADAIDKATVAFKAASAAQRAGSVSDYNAALSQAATAVALVRSLVKG